MNHLMQSPSDPRWKRALDSVLRLAGLDRPAPVDAGEDVEALRQLCRCLVEDLPGESRYTLMLRILHARDRDDLWNLRSHLFGAVSLQFGEHVARERLQRLDALWG